ncbi:Phthalate 4,5-dioxygenase oxygenase subunit [Variovorax sp. SRS16]|uniref:Rieske 2Fe-2S domain-containing protein n=1 Tax=Variovorax sp. SRS16 TaxID=282217 RepID=UPI001318C647|nr:Rieske 2Fe-2S domain-containing protein [Variovorax sp. SRS16]VTU13180.1 Phthalate 4,5-dioxygenase oxygenase subunit [Variovorax sp. SRS16]
MLNSNDNKAMCQVGPGEPMGRLLRRHWLPFMVAADLPAGGDPKDVPLVGENFVAWRDAEGRPALFEDGCLHRGASLLLARSEGDGLRCIYHGWKFATDGTVLDTPNVADAAYRGRLRGRTSPVRESGGILWTYLGAAGQEPDFPRWPWMDLPESQRVVAIHVQECNFVQIIEGLVDSSHLGFLHTDTLRKTGGSDLEYAQKVNSMQDDLAPKIEAEDTPFGFYYAALRDIRSKEGNSRREARVAGFVAPFTILNANGDLHQIVIPQTDTRSIFFHVYYSESRPLNEEPLRSQQLRIVGMDDDTLQRFHLTPETLGRGDYPQRTNYFHQDRAAMRDGRTWSGVSSLTMEDAIVCVSAGAVRDRSRETLSTADVAITRLYRALLSAVESQEVARIDWVQSRGFAAQLAPGQEWRDLLP